MPSLLCYGTVICSKDLCVDQRGPGKIDLLFTIYYLGRDCHGLRAGNDHEEIVKDHGWIRKKISHVVNTSHRASGKWIPAWAGTTKRRGTGHVKRLYSLILRYRVLSPMPKTEGSESNK